MKYGRMHDEIHLLQEKVQDTVYFLTTKYNY